MTLDVNLPPLGGHESELWSVLFDLYERFEGGWSIVGAQMVILHASANQVARPQRTEDVDVLVNLQSMSPRAIAQWLEARGFDMQPISADGFAHEFRRGLVRIDVLATDSPGPRSDTTTVPPARTVHVPGGRRAAGRTIEAHVRAGRDLEGMVPVPDWIGALTLKARAASELGPAGRDKHLSDFALLLSLPVDVFSFAKDLSARERRQLQTGIDLLTPEVWALVEHSVDPRVGMAAARLLRP